MKSLNFFGFVLVFTFIVGIQSVFAMANCVVGATDRSDLPDTNTINQNIFTSSSSVPVLTVFTDTHRVIGGNPASFKIRASVPPRNDLSVEMFIGVHSTETAPNYITDNDQLNRSEYQLGRTLEMKLYDGLTVQFPAGQREHLFSLNTTEDPVIGDHAIFMVLNPNTQQENYEVDNSFDQYYAGAVVIDKNLKFSISSIPGESFNKGDCTKFRLLLH